MASIDLKPGDRLQDAAGRVVVLVRRKDPNEPTPNQIPFHPGWWVDNGGGLADFVIDAEDSEWTVVRGDDEDEPFNREEEVSRLRIGLRLLEKNELLEAATVLYGVQSRIAQAALAERDGGAGD